MSFLVSKHSLYLPFILSLSAFKDLQIRQLNIYLSYATLNVALSKNQTNESRNSLLKNVFIMHTPQTQLKFMCTVSSNHTQLQNLFSQQNHKQTWTNKETT